MSACIAFCPACRLLAIPPSEGPRVGISFTKALADQSFPFFLFVDWERRQQTVFDLRPPGSPCRHLPHSALVLRAWSYSLHLELPGRCRTTFIVLRRHSLSTERDSGLLLRFSGLSL